MSTIQNITSSTILAGPGNTPKNAFDFEVPFIPAFTANSYTNTSSSSSSSSHIYSAGHYEVNHDNIHSTLPLPIQRPRANTGLGLGLPNTITQRTTRAPGSTYSRRPLPPIPTRPASAPLRDIIETERLRMRRSSVAALIGLGIYIPNVPLPGQNINEIPNWVGNSQQCPPSPPLLPTRRSSPTRITTILDDDITPPTFSIFTPEISSPSPAPRYTFREAPPAEDLPTPFVNFNPSTPITTYNQGLGFSNLSEPQQSTISHCYSSNTSASSSRSQSLDSPHTSFTFQPFTSIPQQNEKITTASGVGLGITFNTEPEYHLPTNLLMSPQADDIILDSPFAGFMEEMEARGRSKQRRVGLGISGIVYETSTIRFY